MVTRIIPRELSRTELVKAVVEHISKNGRAVHDSYSDLCLYVAPNGNRCAVGSCLPEPLALRLQSEGIGNLSDYLACDYDEESEIRLEVQKELAFDIHPLEFWDQLQRLHDDPSYWEGDANGRLKLSPDGRNHFDGLIAGE